MAVVQSACARDAYRVFGTDPNTLTVPGTPLPLDTSQVGTYVLLYTVSDLAGNPAVPKKRIVEVVPSDQPCSAVAP